MGRIHLALTGLVACAALAFGVAFAFASSSNSPSPGEYTNGVASGAGKTSVQIDVNAKATKVTTLLSCFQKHGVQVEADNGPDSYRLHHGAFSFDKIYEVDKLIPDNGDTVEEEGHGRVLLTGRFADGKFSGKVQIQFTGERSLHLGGGCRETRYVAPMLVVG
jgi:hypothetical protein